MNFPCVIGAVFSFFTFFQLCIGQSFAQGEMSSKFIGDRFDVYNGQIHYKLWSIAEFLLANSSQFDLSAKEQLGLRISKNLFFKRPYLFEEEAYWVEHTEREISLEVNLSSELEAESKRLFIWLSRNLSDSKLNLYKDPKFVEPWFLDEIDSAAIETGNSILLREAWYYDKVNNELENHIIGIGIKAPERVFWLYYPKLKSKYKFEYPDNLLDYSLKTALFVVDNLKFEKYNEVKSDFKLLVLEHVYRNQEMISGGDKVLSDTISYFDGALIFEYRNKLLIGRYVWKNLSGRVRETGGFVKGLRNGEVRTYFDSGELQAVKNYKNGFLNGKQLEFNKIGEVVREFHFTNKVINGEFKSVSEYLKVQGVLEKGLCVGEWSYEVALPQLWRVILKRNPKYFDRYYKFESSWKSTQLLSGTLKFKADFKYFKADNCLNKQCLSVEIKPH